MFSAPFGRRPKATALRRRGIPFAGAAPGIGPMPATCGGRHSARVARSADGDIGGYLGQGYRGASRRTAGSYLRRWMETWRTHMAYLLSGGSTWLLLKLAE
jgi:hypothetical protein